MFNDVNNNGARDSGEPGLSGWTVYLDANNNGRLDPGEQTAVTEALGNHLFPSRPGGNYAVRQVTGTGFAQTAPIGYAVTMSVTAGGTASEPVFGDVMLSSVTMNLIYFLTVKRYFGKAGTFAGGDLNGDGLKHRVSIGSVSTSPPAPPGRAPNALSEKSNIEDARAACKQAPNLNLRKKC